MGFLQGPSGFQDSCEQKIRICEAFAQMKLLFVQNSRARNVSDAIDLLGSRPARTPSRDVAEQQYQQSLDQQDGGQYLLRDARFAIPKILEV